MVLIPATHSDVATLKHEVGFLNVGRFRGRLVLVPVVVALLVMACTGGSDAPAGLARQDGRGAAARAAARIVGPLTTDGQKILDRAGQPVRLQSIGITSMARGVGLPGEEGTRRTGCPGWRSPTSDQYDNVVAWGFNSVRMTLSWANLEPMAPTRNADGSLVHQYNEEYLRALDAAVKGFTDRGIAVVMKVSQSQWSPVFKRLETPGGVRCQGVGMPVWLYEGKPISQREAKLSFFSNRDNVQEGFLDVWREVATRYASDPFVVAFDMFNEPYTSGAFPPSQLRLNELYEKIASTIRAANPKTLLLFQDSNDTGNGVFALTGPPSVPGVVYSFHLYTDNWDPEGKTRFDHYYERAREWNVPLDIGEFDSFGYASPSSPGRSGPRWSAELQKMLVYSEARHVSWSVFTYARRWFLNPVTEQPRPGLLPLLREDF